VDRRSSSRPDERGTARPSTDLDRLLDFAARSRLADGGFGYLGDDGRVLPDRPVETWIVARMTHVFGLARLLGRPG
jgi:mannose/cellobiose epimerase-like protein (N-acyl-D-glucosamine 2-epimerase family)